LLLAVDCQSHQGLWVYCHDNDLAVKRQNYHSLQHYRWISKYLRMREKYYNPDIDKLPALSHTTLQAELIAQTFDGQRRIYRLTQQTLSLAIVRMDNRLKMSYFLGSNRCRITVWGSRDLASIASAGQSRINLP
jgi:hypothetical protein